MKNSSLIFYCLLFMVLISGGIYFAADFSAVGGSTLTEDPIPAANLSTDPLLDVGCTVVYGADQEQAYGGNNEDSSYPMTLVWFIPPDEGKYGMALFGYDNFIWQGGVNDQGLFFDGLFVNEEIHVDQGDKPRYQGSLPGKALAECANVGCVKDMFEEYHAYDDWMNQFLFGDASGSSVIIEPTTMLDGGGPFQIATNFYLSRTNINECRDCDRYWTARSLFEGPRDLSVELIREILDAVHLEGDYPTLYSTIYDLKKGLIYLYHFHNYGDAVILDLADELSKGYHSYYLAELFPENLDFVQWAETELVRLEESRARYIPVEVDPQAIGFYLGDYVAPEGYQPLFDYYTVAYERGKLVLKMLPDKAWMELTPTSETSFVHVSSMSEFEITFLPDEHGVVNKFNYHYLDHDYLFTRMDTEQPAESGFGIEEQYQDSSFLSEQLVKITRFFGTNTFKFLAIILGLITLQTLLNYLRSLLV